jgi:hypothetical protein
MRSKGSATVTPLPPGATKLSRAEIEALLEATFGTAPRDADDLRVERALVASQQAVLDAIAAPGSQPLTSEQVELALDAIEDYGDCEIAGLAGVDWFSDNLEVPALETAAFRALISRAAAREGVTAPSLLRRTVEGIAATEAALEAALGLLEQQAGNRQPWSRFDAGRRSTPVTGLRWSRALPSKGSRRRSRRHASYRRARETAGLQARGPSDSYDVWMPLFGRQRRTRRSCGRSPPERARRHNGSIEKAPA